MLFKSIIINKKVLVAAGLVLVVVAGWLLAAMLQTPSANNPETALAHGVKHLDPKYQCPMHPQIIQIGRAHV